MKKIIAGVKDGFFMGAQDMQKEFSRLDGKMLEVTIKRYRKKRTLPQNKYYHGIVLAGIAAGINQSGKYQKPFGSLFTPEDAKNLVKENIDIDGITKTSEMSTEQMGRLIDTLIKFAADDLQMWIPGSEECNNNPKMVEEWVRETKKWLP